MSRPKLRTLRQQKGLTLKQMAAFCGVSESFLSRYERGYDSGTVIKPETLGRIGMAYGVRIRQSAAPEAR